MRNHDNKQGGQGNKGKQELNKKVNHKYGYSCRETALETHSRKTTMEK